MLIKNGLVFEDFEEHHVISGRFTMKDIMIEQDDNGKGVIANILEFGSGVQADQEIDAMGLYVSPGLVDAHVHFRDPGQTEKEDIFTGAEAAKRGGYTTVIMMANTSPPIDNVETLRYVLDKGVKTGINVKACACVSKDMKGEELVDMEALVKAGAVGFTDDGKPLMNARLVEKAMVEAKRLDVPISFHEEDPNFIVTPGFNASDVIREGLGIEGADAAAEYGMVARDASIADMTKADVIFQHISSSQSKKIIRHFRHFEKTYNIHAEVTPHHFTLTEDDAVRLGSLAKMNPPLRTNRDREIVASGIADGTIEIIATDHAPHTDAEKAMSPTESPSGVIGLETAFGLAITELCYNNRFITAYPPDDNVSIARVLKCMSTNPARIYGLDAGTIKIGAPADITIFNPLEKWIVDEKEFASKASNSPFIGMELLGRVKFTICNGKIVYVHDPSLLC